MCSILMPQKPLVDLSLSLVLELRSDSVVDGILAIYSTFYFYNFYDCFGRNLQFLYVCLIWLRFVRVLVKHCFTARLQMEYQYSYNQTTTVGNYEMQIQYSFDNFTKNCVTLLYCYNGKKRVCVQTDFGRLHNDEERSAVRHHQDREDTTGYNTTLNHLSSQRTKPIILARSCTTEALYNGTTQYWRFWSGRSDYYTFDSYLRPESPKAQYHRHHRDAFCRFGGDWCFFGKWMIVGDLSYRWNPRHCGKRIYMKETASEN